MRVVLVSPYSRTVPGGVQGQVAGLAAALRARGHPVLELAPDDGRPPGPSADGTAEALGRSLRVRANGSVAPVTLWPAVAARARRAAAAFAPDVVHLHEPLAPVAGWELLRRPPAPLLATFHRAGASAPYRLAGRAARPLLARLGDRVAVSAEAAATARAALGGEYEVLFNGVEVERLAGAEPWPTERPTALFVGRHEPRKGLAVLLAAWAALGEAGTLWVAGHGPETEALRRAHPGGDRLVWLGRVDEEEKARRLAGAHVLVAPALSGESFGMVLLEGLAARCVVVASDLPGFADAGAGHVALVPPGDVDALGHALGAALAQAAAGTGRAAPAALAAGAAHAEGWSMARLAAEYEARYARLAPGAAGRGR